MILNYKYKGAIDNISIVDKGSMLYITLDYGYIKQLIVLK